MEPPFSNDLKEIADSMGIALYQRFTVAEASLFLRCPIDDVKQLQRQRKIDSINITDTQFEFFGYQLLQHLLNGVTHNKPHLGVPDNTPDRIIRAKEVQEMIGISRTTLWRMEKKGEFPRRVSLGVGSVGWRLGEVKQWINQRETV